MHPVRAGRGAGVHGRTSRTRTPSRGNLLCGDAGQRMSELFVRWIGSRKLGSINLLWSGAGLRVDRGGRPISWNVRSNRTLSNNPGRRGLSSRRGNRPPRGVAESGHRAIMGRVRRGSEGVKKAVPRDELRERRAGRGRVAEHRAQRESVRARSNRLLGPRPRPADLVVPRPFIADLPRSDSFRAAAAIVSRQSGITAGSGG